MDNLAEKNTEKKQLSPYLIAMAVMLPTAIEVLDTSIANVVLPYIAGSLAVTVDDSSWMITMYLVFNAIILPITGWLTEIFGRKKYLLISIFIFTLSSFMCGIVTSLNQLLFFRALQGLGGGGLMPISQAILLEQFPGEKKSIGMGIYGMGVILAPIFGPMLGGYIADNFYWGWIFFINVPIGLISMIMVYLIIEKDNIKKQRKIKVDYLGLASISIGIAALQMFLDKGQRFDWFNSNFIICMLVLAVFCILFTVFWELKCEKPIIDLRLLKDRNFFVCVVAMFIIGIVFYSINEAIPLFLQNLKGYTAFQSGLVIGIAGMPMFIFIPLSGVMGAKINPKWIIVFGWGVIICAVYSMTLFNLNVGFWNVASVRSFMAIGISANFVLLSAVAFMFIPKDKIDYGTGMINLVRNIGGSFGIAMVNTVIARNEQIYQVSLSKHISELNPVFMQTYETIKHGLGMPNKEALKLIYLELSQQAGMLSYNNCFWRIVIILIITFPFLLLLKYNKNLKSDIGEKL